MNFIFDVDETLYDMTQPFQRAAQALWSNTYPIDMHALFLRTREYSNQIFDNILAGKVSLDDAGAYRVRMAMQDFGYAVSEEEAMQFQKRYRQYEYDIQLSPTISSMLTYLKERATLGILTNGLITHQQKKMDGMQLHRWFPKEYMFISEAIGASKPDRKAFQFVETAMNINKQDTWFIGDSIIHDVEGAKQAGWHMIFLNRRHYDTTEMKHQPDHIVTSEEALFDLIQTLSK